MSGKQKIWLSDARLAAEAICRLLAPACDRIEIAGSIRRQAAQVGDIEIVCQPKIDIDAPDSLSAVDGLVESLIPGDGLPFGPDSAPDSGLRWPRKADGKKANGTRYKRLIWVGSSGPLERIPVDLFCVVPPASWGAILAIRTGPAEFGRGLVTKRSQGGALPDELQQRDGALWGRGGKIDTPEESDYFAAVGVPYWPPEDRTTERLEEFLAGTFPA